MFLRRVFHSCPPRFIQKGVNKLFQKRFLNTHEYQSLEILSQYGINTPKSKVASTIEEVERYAKEIGTDVVIKAQILAGGRGKGYFLNGFKGGVHIALSPEQAKELAKHMLGQILVTKQTGNQGRPCNKVLVQERLYARRELYFAIVLDRSSDGPVIVASTRGGMNIEDVAKETPEEIFKIKVDIMKGVSDKQLEQVAANLGFQSLKEIQILVDQMKKMWKLFCEKDATQLEINPLIETPDHRIVCADVKLNIDDNAEFRQQELFKLRDLTQIDPREVHAQQFNLQYIGLDGNIGCIVNGAGLAMATLDIIKLYGGNPANFLDVGGSATQQQIQEALKILDSDKNVKAILVNIFGGIMKCDIIARAIIAAAQIQKLHVPLIVRLQGTNVELANKILSESEVKVVPASDLDQAAQKAVKIANIVSLAEEIQVKVDVSAK